MKVNCTTRELVVVFLFTLLISLTAAPATASPITYAIIFTGTGTLPSAGTFTYDSDTSTFTNFFVIWNALVFNLTPSANNPFLTVPGPACISGLSGGAATFAVMTGTCTPPGAGGRTLWSANTQDRFFFFTTDATNTQTLAVQGISSHPIPTENNEGGWHLSTVPEPSTLLFMMAAFVCIGLFTAARGSEALRQ